MTARCPVNGSRREEPLADGVGAEAAYAHAFLARPLPRFEGHVPRTNAEAVGQEPQELPVRGPGLGRGRHADAERPAAQAGDAGS